MTASDPPGKRQRDAISTIATISLPVFIIYRLITGGLNYAFLLIAMIAVISMVYLWLGFADDDDGSNPCD